MSISTNLDQANRELTIQVSGRFDFSQHSDFRVAYENGGEVPACYVIDLNSVDYMDSSALGMLLILREHAGGESSSVALRNCGVDIKEILQTANFQKLFNIS